MKNLVKSKRAEGFTIIEVMIVLAIAALIMVIVFIAVPQLQRNQRDNARQNIVNRIKAEMETYAGNNQGAYPFGVAACGAGNNTGNICDFVNRYIGTGTGPATSCNPNNGKVNTCDPSTALPALTGASNVTGKPQAYTAAIASSIPSSLTAGNLEIIFGAKCSGESVVQSGTGAITTGVRTYAVVMGLDRSGTAYCVDNG